MLLYSVFCQMNVLPHSVQKKKTVLLSLLFLYISVFLNCLWVNDELRSSFFFFCVCVCVVFRLFFFFLSVSPYWFIYVRLFITATSFYTFDENYHFQSWCRPFFLFVCFEKAAKSVWDEDFSLSLFVFAKRNLFFSSVCTRRPLLLYIYVIQMHLFFVCCWLFAWPRFAVFLFFFLCVFINIHHHLFFFSNRKQRRLLSL